MGSIKGVGGVGRSGSSMGRRKSGRGKEREREAGGEVIVGSIEGEVFERQGRGKSTSLMV